MSRMRQQGQAPFRPDSEHDSELTAGTHSGAIYVGLGDCFDDDRRLVRETGASREARIRLTRVGYFRRQALAVRG
jgi:hypothetical protein